MAILAADRMRATVLTAAILATVLAPAADAAAGGFYLMPRGTRPLGRAGAMVAGADDPHALWYNPAGLAYSGDQLLVDFTLSLFETQYARIDSGGTTLPEVTGYHAYLPIPTIGGSFSVDELPEWTFGLSVQAPNSALLEWPQDRDAPQRYSLLSLEGSLLATAAVAAAWRPLKELSIGLAAHLLFGSFDATVALSACDGVICTFPEDPDYDGIANIGLPVVFPFFVLGTTIDLDVVRIGFSVSTPFNLEGSSLVRVRPPSAAAFQGAEVVNRRPGCNWEDESDPCRDDTRANTQLEFPWVVSLGVEVRPTPELRIELAGVYESWSVQDQALIDPVDTWIQGALGGGLEYQVGPLSIPRNMNDTVSVRLGGQYTIERVVDVRLGVMYENGAFSDEYLSALTIDSDKVLISAGVGVNVSDEVRLDATGGYLWMADRHVRTSMVPQANPIRPPGSTGEAVYIGNGDYSMGAPYFGIAFTWRGDAGNLRGPGTEEPPAQTTPENTGDEDDEPDEGAGSEPDAPESSDAPPSESDDAPEGDETTPWYLRGSSGSDADE